MACVPAASWCLGLLIGEAPAFPDAVRLARSGVVAYLGIFFSVLMLAASLYLLAPLFIASRNWARSLQVAAYSSAPLLLAGFVLIVPSLVLCTLVAAMHSFYLQYLGVFRILGAREDESAEYVALGFVLLIALSALLGAIGGWLGAI